ncbi:MAG TPA: GAF domain-containing SpoIIE family protein phosphatase [Acidothermaceae bacterium]
MVIDLTGAAEATTRAEAAETARLEAVQRYNILDTPPDAALDRITALAARLLRAPIAIVSVVDADRIRFMSHHGTNITQIDRHPGLCASAILGEQPWVVTDAEHDPRTSANPLVSGGFGLRLYAGVPLTTRNGHNLGTLCVIDRQPRDVTDDEIQTLRDLAAIVVDQLEFRQQARLTIAESDQRHAEVEALASALQTSLLPPALPTIPGVDIAAAYHPASKLHVGGDFYDVFPLDGGCWGVAIGDVCGKGPQAAVRTGAARYGLRTVAIEETSPAQALTVLNQALLTQALSADLDADPRFVTVGFARVQPRAGRAIVRFAVAGHPLPTVMRADGEVFAAGSPGSLLGVLTDVNFTDTTVELHPGDTFVFVTDGVLDSGDPPLGRDGMENALAACAGFPPAAIVERLLLAATSAQRDDIAILALQSRQF